MDSFTIYDPPAITVDAGPNRVIQEGTTIQLQATVAPAGHYDYQWLPTNGVLNPTKQATDANPSQNTLYTITITNTQGCSANDTVLVTVKPEVHLFIPNAFSPNGDGNNDLFKVVGGPFEFFHLSIYNRWGTLVYESDNESDGWDGRYRGLPQAVGTYIYIVRATDEFGVPFTREGNVILLR